jgi:hypothetical protein
MRTLKLARVAADAEILLLRRKLQTLQRRAIYGVVAAVFAVGVLILLHVMAYLALETFAHLTPFISVCIVGGVDLALVIIFALLASGKMPDPVAEEAIQLRDQSIAQMKTSMSAAAVLVPAGRFLGRKQIYALALAGMTARFLRSRK